MGDFWAFENRTTITATLVMKTALSIGSQASLLPTGSDLPVIKTPEGLPYIPGSSLKGVVRAYTERLLCTLDEMGLSYRDQRLWACDPLDERVRCVTATCGRECTSCERCEGDCCDDCRRCKRCMTQRAAQDGHLNDEVLTQELFELSCTACRLFGSPWLASRVAFQDAMLLNNEELLRRVEVRDGVGIDRDLGTAKPGIKYDFETVPSGARFGVRIVVENVEDWELGLLLLALEALVRGEIPLGGKTSRGLGWGELRDLRVERLRADQLLDWLTDRAQLEALPPEELIRVFRSGLSQGE